MGQYRIHWGLRKKNGSLEYPWSKSSLTWVTWNSLCLATKNNRETRFPPTEPAGGRCVVCWATPLNFHCHLLDHRPVLFAEQLFVKRMFRKVRRVSSVHKHLRRNVLIFYKQLKNINKRLYYALKQLPMLFAATRLTI